MVCLRILPLAALLTVSGCSLFTPAPPEGEQLLEQADLSRGALEEKQEEILQILDPQGQAPTDFDRDVDMRLNACDTNKSKYQWSSRVDIGNTDGWRFPTDETEWRVHIGEELHDLGWEDIKGTSFDSDGPSTTMVHTSYPDVVKEALLRFHPGKVADGVSILLEGECQPGNHRDILDLLRESANN